MKTNNFAKTAFYKFAVAATLSSLGITISTFVDSVLIGNSLGEIGIAAANIVSPVFMMLNMLGFTIAIGASIFIASDLGQYNIKSAQNTFSIAVIFGGFVCVLTYIAIFFFFNDIFYFLGATEVTIEYCKQYGDIVLLFAPIFIMSPILSICVRSDASPTLATISAIVVVVVNIVLDIVLMFGFSMGIRGAAIAICVAEFLGVLVCLSHFWRKNSLLKLALVTPKLGKIAAIFKNGFGTGSAYVFQSIVVIVFNNILAEKFDVSHMAIFGVLTSVFLFAYALFDGISLAISPLVSTYMGEKDGSSIRTTMREALKVILIISAFLLVFVNIFAKNIITIFGITDINVLTLATKSLMLYSLSIVLMCVNSVAISYFQSMKRDKQANITSVLKNLLFVLLFGIVLVPKFGVIGIAVTYILSELTSFLFMLGSVLFIKKREKVASFLLIPEFTSSHYEITIESSLDQFNKVSEGIEIFCQTHDIKPKTAFFLNFIIEELLLNIIKMGIKDNKVHNIKIKVMKNGEDVNIWIRDDVKSYNPFETSGDDIDNSVMLMIKNKAIYYDYQRRLVFNNLYIII